MSTITHVGQAPSFQPAGPSVVDLRASASRDNARTVDTSKMVVAIKHFLRNAMARRAQRTRRQLATQYPHLLLRVEAPEQVARDITHVAGTRTPHGLHISR